MRSRIGVESMPLTTPDEIEEKPNPPVNSDAPELEFDGREMTTIEALQILHKDIAGLWDAISKIERGGVADADLEDTVAEQEREIRELQERVEELEREEHNCARCGESLSGDETHCTGCGQELDWEAL